MNWLRDKTAERIFAALFVLALVALGVFLKAGWDATRSWMDERERKEQALSLCMEVSSRLATSFLEARGKLEEVDTVTVKTSAGEVQVRKWVGGGE